LAANLHALYSLIPFVYLGGYILMFHRHKKWTTLAQCCGLFMLMALPLLAWIIQKKINLYGLHDKHFYAGWIDLYKIACPQNFIFYDNTIKEVLGNFSLFMERTRQYWLLVVFFLANLCFNPDFRQDKKSLSVIIVGFGLLIFSFIFTYIYPSRFVLDLNLVRNTQFMLFILMGYTVILIDRSILTRPPWVLLPVAMVLPLIRFLRLGNEITILAGCCLMAVLGLHDQCQKQKNIPRTIGIIFWGGLGLLALGMILHDVGNGAFNKLAQIIIVSNYALMILTAILFFSFKNIRPLMKKTLIIIPFCVFFCNFVYYHHLHRKIETTGGDFWQLQRNWEDMQHYVRNNLPRNAKLLVPYDMEMGGFRIFSERKIVVSYRDCGIIGFNYEAAKEWQKRIQDVEAFKFMASGDIAHAIINAVAKYRVHYIVFMNYIAPQDNDLFHQVYQNEIYSLHKIKANPVE